MSRIAMASVACCATLAAGSHQSPSSSLMPPIRGQGSHKVVADTGAWQLEIVKRSEAHKFIVLPKRWIVERTFAWIARNRRLARDFERYASTVVAFVRLAMIRIMLRRLTKVTPYP